MTEDSSDSQIEERPDCTYQHVQLRDFMNENNSIQNNKNIHDWEKLLNQSEYNSQMSQIQNYQNDNDQAFLLDSYQESNFSISSIRSRISRVKQKPINESTFWLDEEISVYNEINSRLSQRALYQLQQKKAKKNNQKQIMVKCQCSKTKCLKQYCSCFQKGMSCNQDCTCLDCENQGQLQKIKIPKTKENLNLNNIVLKGCKCTKNSCSKRYCECKNKSMFCSILCQCVDCKNQAIKKHKIIQDVDSSDELDKTQTKMMKIRKKIHKINLKRIRNNKQEINRSLTKSDNFNKNLQQNLKNL